MPSKRKKSAKASLLDYFLSILPQEGLLPDVPKPKLPPELLGPGHMDMRLGVLNNQFLPNTPPAFRRPELLEYLGFNRNITPRYRE